MNIPHIPVGLSPLIFIDPVSAKETTSINNYTWSIEPSNTKKKSFMANLFIFFVVYKNIYY